jgi:MFS transporter, DHA1 family, inner membrane transport protein
MRIFDNSNVNKAYLQSSFAMLAYAMGEIFSFAYLLKAGFSVALVFCAMAGWALLRLVLRRLLLPAVLKFGLRNCLIFGTLVDAIAFMIVSQISAPGPLLGAYIFCFAVGNGFYWACYHAMIAMIGDAEHRGAQVSFKEAISALLGIVGPLLSAFLLINFGPVVAFVVPSILLLISTIPLFGIFTPPILIHATLAPEARKQVFDIFFADGLRAAANYYVWSIALFQVLGESFSAFGAVLAAASVVGAIMSLGIGKLIDIGHQKKASQIAFAVMAAAVALKTIGFGTAWIAIAASTVSAVALPLYASVMMTRVYNLSQQSTCPLRFQIVGEGAWDVGVAFGCLLAAMLAYMGFGYFWPLLLGFVGCWLGYKAQAIPDGQHGNI